MKFFIRHEIRGRMRVHMDQRRMSYAQADILEYHLRNQPGISFAKVYERTGNAVISFDTDRESIILILARFCYDAVEVPPQVLESSTRELNAYYKEKLICRVLWYGTKKLFVPEPIRAVITTIKAIRFVHKGLKSLSKGRVDVSVLDAVSVFVSLLRRDFSTAGFLMFLLGIGELLEEWTHKRSVADLAQSMSLRVGKVWKIEDGQEMLVAASEIQVGDHVVVRMGAMIPFDGKVDIGEGAVNQSSFTGESIAVIKKCGDTVYAGTCMEEGEITISVSAVGAATKYEKIIEMIEESEQLKSSAESRAEHLADRLVPYTLGGTALTWLVSRNVTKALSVLMVDFSCALKLAMPISVLSAIREAGEHGITVKGGKFLEAVADADTIVFDKTGTLTKARPTVKCVVTFAGEDADEYLRMAACLEEHFPHSMARAVVNEAMRKHLEHREMHSKVEYIVAHGISSRVEGRKVVIGSYHFVFEDEGCTVPDGMEERFCALPGEYSYLYLAVENKLAAAICIEDPMREEAFDVIEKLRGTGIKKVVMMTGDSERAAASVAKRAGLDEYFSEVLPEEKAGYVQREQSMGHKVIMVGDGINDSPALSAADVGVAISDGAELAREIADITIAADDLNELLTLKLLGNALRCRIQQNYRHIVGFNAILIALGIAGAIAPATSSLLHNTSTVYVGARSTRDLLEGERTT